MTKKFIAEMIGTMILVLMGCGAAVFNGGATSTAAVLTIAFAFGLSVLAMVYTIGGISGCHINPAITFGFWLSGRMKTSEAIVYWIAQVIGAIIGSSILFALVINAPNLATGATMTGANEFAYGNGVTAFIAEAVFTFIFVLVVLATTSTQQKASKFAGIAIGLTLVLCHIVCIPITGTSVNPARSIGPAIFQGGKALSQLWLFIIAPLLGASFSAMVWRIFEQR